MPESMNLSSFSEKVVDCEHKTAPATSPGQEYAYSIGTSDIRDGRILLETAKQVDKETYKIWTARSIPQEGDLILAREAPVGEVGYVPHGIRVCLGQRTVLIRPDRTKVNPRFLHYLLLSPAIQKSIHAQSSGSTVAHLNVKDIRALPVPQPPDRPLQDRIASLLGSLDDKIAINKKISETCVELASAKFTEAEQGLSGWHQSSLAQAARWLSGGTPRTDETAYWGGTIPWISAASLKSPWIDRSDRNVTVLGSKNGTRLMPEGTIIFVVRGMSLKDEFRIGVAQREVAFGQDCKALVPNDQTDPLILFYSLWIRKNDILEMVDEAGHETGRLATDRLQQMTITIPTAAEQHRITSLLRPLSEAAARRQAESRILAELRDTLLPKLLSGELRIRDAEKVVEDAV